MAQMPFAEHNNMVKTIPSDRTDQPLCISAKRSTPNFQISTRTPADYPIFRGQCGRDVLVLSRC
jgi:hypothetical protein